MRVLSVALAVLLGGCELVLGIDEPLGHRCVPLSAGQCEQGETCDLAEDGFRDCREAGIAQAGAICFEPDQCGTNLSCVDGLCRSFCGNDDDCESSEAECIRQWAGWAVCDSDCDVLAGTGCPNDEELECMMSLNDFGSPLALCVPEGWFGDVGPGGTCTFLSECIETYGCWDDDNDDVGICTPLCQVGSTCPDGVHQCMAVFETLHGTSIGLCPEP